ncbi:hypothetical protein QWY87_03850 [Lutimonas halocynthiae]|uniref:hypothetical protein n=1 Tax=Lutimonas halocynthiae TaxID=1446477 RepID=UPI0025B58A44|nr:hypothetical protein [Lutimonas halocynthiae]MDN3641819.1 hypothetical protein [Lutimonas halocynthiae]
MGITKKIAVLIIFLLTFGAGMAQTSKDQNSTVSWEEVQVVYDLSEVADMTMGKRMTETIKTSLNFGTKSKVKRNCLKELQKKAADQGYSVIYIDEEASKDKRFNKRGIEVTLVGVGFKG